MELLDRMLRHDSWTTGQLIARAAELGDSGLDQDFDMGHRTIRRTLEHVIWNMECWTDLIAGNPVRERRGDQIDVLQQRHRAIETELLEFARRVSDEGRLNESFVDHRANPPKRWSLAGGLQHIATHGMHHRAQLLWMMRRAGAEDLPEGDALSWEAACGESPAAPPSSASGEVCDQPSEAEMKLVDKKLKEFNAGAMGNDDFTPLNLVVRGTDGELIAGLKALTGWNWMYIALLWVDDSHRGAGLGTRLVQFAEAKAIERGCIGVCLTTFSFQAPDFYKRLGYEAWGQIDEYPPGERMQLLLKRLS